MYYKTRKPGWFIKRKFLDYVFNDKNSGSYSDQMSTLTKGSYLNKESTKDLTLLYNKYLDPIVGKFGNGPYHMNEIWYQYYGKNTGSYHDYHHHYAPDCQISGIYYLRLKDARLKTQFLGITEVFVEEGDLILFDSQLLHRAPPNDTKYDKIVLSFNLERR